MKKILIFTLGLMVLMSGLAYMPGAARAGIEGTAHDPAVAGFTSIAKTGKCGACHIPHGAQGKRLWPVTVTSQSMFTGEVAVLCAYCHDSAGGAGLSAAYSDSFVFGLNSHGVMMSTSTAPYGQVANSFPYAGSLNDGHIECTSCHNVHDDTNRPFLRSDIDTLCSVCHGDRMWAAGIAKEGSAIIGSSVFAWGASVTYMGANNNGSHPVGSDVTTDQGVDSPISIPNWFKEPKNAIAQQWSLGGHLSGTGVVCVTCHDVHGLQEDSQDLTPFGLAAVTPNTNMLTVSQTSVLIGRDVANGTGDPRNYLCEACHDGHEPGTSYASPNVVWNDLDSTAVKYSNPGATTFGHPVDSMASISGTSWVTAFPVSWPSGNNTQTDPNPICESCHAPHSYADRVRADLVNANAGVGIATTGDTNYILRGKRATVCNDCHSPNTATNNASHHPVGLTFRNDGVTYLNGTGSAAALETLNCSTCHSAGGAHNWAGYSRLGMDANWIPKDNARGSFYATSMSTTCIDCHYSLDSNTTNDSPTKHDGVLTAYAGTDVGFSVIGSGTHFLGQVTSTAWAALNPGIAVTNTDWFAEGGKVGARSRFGGSAATPIMICESCHELQPSLNAGVNKHLLLVPFFDGDNGAGGNTTGRDGFCEGCHLPSGTHPQTGDTVSRTGLPLSTDTTVAWLKAPSDASFGATWVDTNLTFGTAPVLLSCDSCHQVHDANSEGHTYILDAKNSNVTAGSTQAQTGIAGYADSVWPVRAVNSNAKVEDLCGTCHPYR